MDATGGDHPETAPSALPGGGLDPEPTLLDVGTLFRSDRWAEAASAGRRLLGRAFGLALDGRPKDPETVADAATWLMRIARRQAQLDDALRWAGIAVHAAVTAADAGRECLARAERARVLSALGETEEALEQSYAALYSANAAGQPMFEATALDALADVQWSMAQWDDALRSYARMLELSVTCGDLGLQAAAHGGLGGINHHLGEAAEGDDDADAAAAHFRLAADEALRYLHCAELAGDAHAARTATHNHAVALLAIGDPQGARSALEALLARFRPGDSAERMNALKNLGDVAIAQGRIDDAIALGCEALALAERLGQPAVAMNCCETLARAFETAGRLGEALAHYRRFHALHVQVASESAQARSRAMAVKYDTDKALAIAMAQRARADRLESRQIVLADEAERLARMSLEDALTGIGNRRRFDQALRTAADAAGGCSLALLDIDHFKRVNDECSHTIGDAVLRRIGALLAASVRHGDLAARYGGEEFALILDGLDRPAARAVCERIREAVAAEDWSALHPNLNVTISIGLAHRDIGGPGDLQPLLELADRRLYAAKRGGRNRVVDDGSEAPFRAAASTTAPGRLEPLPFRATGT